MQTLVRSDVRNPSCCAVLAFAVHRHSTAGTSSTLKCSTHPSLCAQVHNNRACKSRGTGRKLPVLIVIATTPAPTAPAKQPWQGISLPVNCCSAATRNPCVTGSCLDVHAFHTPTWLHRVYVFLQDEDRCLLARDEGSGDDHLRMSTRPRGGASRRRQLDQS